MGVDAEAEMEELFAQDEAEEAPGTQSLTQEEGIHHTPEIDLQFEPLPFFLRFFWYVLLNFYFYLPSSELSSSILRWTSHLFISFLHELLLDKGTTQIAVPKSFAQFTFLLF